MTHQEETLILAFSQPQWFVLKFNAQWDERIERRPGQEKIGLLVKCILENLTRDG